MDHTYSLNGTAEIPNDTHKAPTRGPRRTTPPCESAREPHSGLPGFILRRQLSESQQVERTASDASPSQSCVHHPSLHSESSLGPLKQLNY